MSCGYWKYVVFLVTIEIPGYSEIIFYAGIIIVNHIKPD
mgnify:CR=1 FL=1